METPLVSIACITFNQVEYIRQCLDGFVMQKTNFPIEIIIHDDASTDGTADIIKEYVEKYPNFHWKPILQKTNKFKEGKGILVPYVYPKCTGKYIALCEGDDYWTDPNKLQKQVDFLESNPCYSMCFHKSAILKEVDTDCALRVDLITDRDYNGTELVDHWIVPTASIVMRRECRGYPIKNRENLINGDLPLVLSCCAMGKVRAFSDCMSIYRIQAGGITYDKSRKKEYNMGFPKHYQCLHENFPFVDKNVINRLIAYHLFEIGKDESIVIRKLRYFAQSFVSSPSYATRRFLNILKRIFTKH